MKYLGEAEWSFIQVSRLGHKNGSITSHYSGAEFGHLIEAANKVSATDSRGTVLAILARRQA